MFPRIAMLCAWFVMGCGPRLEMIYLHDPPPGPGTPTAVPAAPSIETTPSKGKISGDPCLQTCTRIAWMDKQAPNPAWITACAERCRVHSSEGQLECYQRVERLEDLKACSTR